MTTILVTGKNGQLGHELRRALASHGDVIAWGRDELDFSEPSPLLVSKLRELRPDIIVNAAAYTAVDKAEAEPELARRVNAIVPGLLAEEARRIGALLIHYSTDYVFDGMHAAPYTEEDIPRPLSVYGRSKLEGEVAIENSGCAYLILRTSWVYSARGSNFVLSMLKLARARSELSVVADQIGTPTWARALANATGTLLTQTTPVANSGVYHLSARGVVSRFDLARKIIDTARALAGDGIPWAEVRPIKTSDYPLPAARPLNSVLNNEKIKRAFGVEMQNWETQLSSCLHEFFGTH